MIEPEPDNLLEISCAYRLQDTNYRGDSGSFQMILKLAGKSAIPVLKAGGVIISVVFKYPDGDAEQVAYIFIRENLRFWAVLAK